MRRLLAIALACAAAACTSATDDALPTPSASTPGALPSSAPASPSPSLPPSPTLAGPPYAGNVAWPRVSRDAGPGAFGAVVTTRRTTLSDGTVISAGVTLPRVNVASLPVVMKPCGGTAEVSTADVRFIGASSRAALPKKPADVVVVLDPGHGGHAAGAVGPNRLTEKSQNLLIARDVQRELTGRVGRVVFTRDRDMDATLPFRVALADALRADAAVSIHLNSSPDQTTRTVPGTEVFGSIADPNGRRFTGLVYEHIRAFLEPMGGPWYGDRDAGAKFRRGKDGRDYYGLLRRSHTPWVIAESMYVISPREAALVQRPDVRRGLARAIADAVVAFTTSAAPGSGWVQPYVRPADPAAGGAGRCTNPSG